MGAAKRNPSALFEVELQISPWPQPKNEKRFAADYTDNADKIKS
jgi:hypothetical protein